MLVGAEAGGWMYCTLVTVVRQLLLCLGMGWRAAGQAGPSRVPKAQDGRHFSR